MLWLCIHLSRLPLEVFTRGSEDDHPLVVHCGSAGRPRVVAASPSAAAAGIRHGQALAAARALHDGLRAHSRDQAAERRALEGVAAWCGQFTSMVSLVPPDAVLLEIGASLKLFGGLGSLLSKLEAGLEQLGYQVWLASAPTPLAAEWLARQQSGILLEGFGKLVRTLSQLPVSMPVFDRDMQDRLAGMGLRQVGDVLRLPRDGLVRRFGADMLLRLDRALGRAPDPRLPFAVPPRFSGHLLLPAEVDNTGALLFAVQRLVKELSGMLRARVAGVRAMNLQLVHGPASVTGVQVGMVMPARNEKYLLGLLRARLEAVQLSAPVQELRLLTDTLAFCEMPSRDLFADAAGETEAPEVLVERLRARLGDEAVQGMQVHADHRPEFAWRWSVPGQASIRPIPVRRPFWLLEEPKVLKTCRGRPCVQQVLQLWPGRERIESGWWDGRDIRRDYFVAQDRDGMRYWIFRELPEPRRWFLHGIFG